MVAAIEIESLGFAYPDGKRALQNINLRIEAGEAVGLIGPNGAGKTTLFLCLAGVLLAEAKSLRIAGLDPRMPADRRQLPAQVGLIFQNSDDQLFSTSVAEDVAFGPLNLGLPADEVRQRVAEALERVGLGGLQDRTPFHLSGGEKRRAALAGVLAMGTDILLLDEPTMFLDPRGRRQLIGLLNELTNTKIIASHDLELISETCRRVAVIDRGEIVALGDAIDVMKDRALMLEHGLETPYCLR